MIQGEISMICWRRNLTMTKDERKAAERLFQECREAYERSIESGELFSLINQPVRKIYLEEQGKPGEN